MDVGTAGLDVGTGPLQQRFQHEDLRHEIQQSDQRQGANGKKACEPPAMALPPTPMKVASRRRGRIACIRAKPPLCPPAEQGDERHALPLMK
jgi:hypothetical protein